MSIKEAYNQWSSVYDSNENKTRDLEAIALRKVLSELQFSNILEIGCGTGKNTEWLINKCETLVAIDFSEQMLQKAKDKLNLQNVNFIQADITKEWNIIPQKPFDIITESLVLEHIEDLNHIFKQASTFLTANGFFYIGELHPFKQYQGSKARFETENDVKVLECFTHHLSDFITHARFNNFKVYHLEEFFDDDDKSTIPRILSILFQKN